MLSGPSPEANLIYKCPILPVAPGSSSSFPQLWQIQGLRWWEHSLFLLPEMTVLRPLKISHVSHTLVLLPTPFLKDTLIISSSKLVFSLNQWNFSNKSPRTLAFTMSIRMLLAANNRKPS